MANEPISLPTDLAEHVDKLFKPIDFTAKKQPEQPTYVVQPLFDNPSKVALFISLFSLAVATTALAISLAIMVERLKE